MSTDKPSASPESEATRLPQEQAMRRPVQIAGVTIQPRDAAETAALTKGQILQQAATAMLAQANQMPNVILSLLK